MPKVALSLLLTTSILTCNYLLVNGSAAPSFKKQPMFATTIAIKTISLIAQEETLPAPGVTGKLERPLISAAIFLELENLKQSEMKLIVQKVEVRNASTGQIELTNQQPEEILLRSLQHVSHDIHLRKKALFAGRGKVKAVVTYRIGDRTQTIESQPVEVQRH